MPNIKEKKTENLD